MKFVLKMIFAATTLMIAACGGAEVSKTGPLKACVFSAVDAKMTLNGDPVVGAKIVRRWDWQKERSDETVTDEQGRFSLPAVYERNAIRLFPAEFAVSQSLTVHYQGQEFSFWVGSKREVEENSELGGISLDLSCELTDEMEIHRLTTIGTLHTVCTWNKN